MAAVTERTAAPPPPAHEQGARWVGDADLGGISLSRLLNAACYAVAGVALFVLATSLGDAGQKTWWPGESDAVYCSATSGSGESDYSADEALVDQLVSALQTVKPIYVVNWEQNGASSCNVAIYPTGTVQFAPDYASSCPSQLTITATPGDS